MALAPSVEMNGTLAASAIGAMASAMPLMEPPPTMMSTPSLLRSRRASPMARCVSLAAS